jgi:hypothetical protein
LPFISHCCEESSFFFHVFSQSVFYDDLGSLTYLFRRYLDDTFRVEVSNSIRQNFSYTDLLRQYTSVLYESLLELLA